MLSNLRDKNNIVILTGAGISVASGLKTYRGPGGVWSEYEVEKYGNIAALEKYPDKVWELFGGLRREVQKAEPNSTHYLLAKLEKDLSDEQSLLVITQNVDGLHKISGSKSLVELHGNINNTSCSNINCDLISFYDTQAYAGVLPKCDRCGELLRPEIVLFGEHIPIDKEWKIKRSLRECDAFISIGTSGTVAPASNYVRSAKFSEALTISINIENQRPKNEYFDVELIGDCESVLQELLE